MSIQRKTLYSISARGSTRFWCVELDADESRYRTVYGTCDLDQSTTDQPYPTGKTTCSQWRYAEAKNIGRSNEVTSNHQALLESLRLIADKKKTGFFEYGQPSEEKFEVMLAHPYEQKRITNGKVFFQPKLDGVRCYIVLKTLEARSRNHNTFPKVESLIKRRVSYIPPEFDNLILDGEIYQRGKDIGEIISAVRLGFEDNNDISFFAFDVIDLANPYMLYDERLELLTQTVQALKPLLTTFISQVETHMIEISPADRPSIEEYINMQHDMYVPPYEGLIIRLNTPYKFGRSPGLMKFKRMMSREFEVIEFVEGEGNS
jgi:ATP-dependent DNA ligase